MPIFLIAFLPIACLTFGVVAIAMRPSREQKAVDRRLASVTVAPDEFGATAEDSTQFLKVERRGPFDWIEHLMEGLSLSRRLNLLIVQANISVTVGTIVIASAAAMLFTIVLTYAISSMLPIACIAAAAAAYLPVAYLKFKCRRRLAAFDATLSDCIDMMSRSLRAGHSMAAAMNIVADQAAEPARTEFGEVFKKQNYGLPLRDALLQMLDRMPSQDLRVLVTGILVQKDTGGNLAEMLDRVVFVIRERMRIKGEIRTHTAQGRLTGWVLCLLPVVMMVMINIINPGYSTVLTSTPFGHKLLYAGVALLAVGAFLIRKIINGIEV